MSDPTLTHLMARQPVKFIARNFRGRHKRLKAGNIWIAEMEVERNVWDTLDTMPDGAMFEVILWITDGEQNEEQPEEKPAKEPKGEWSNYWRELFRRGFYNSPELCEALQVNSLTADSVRQLLHDAFETTSLTLVSPSTFEDFCATRELHSLFTMSRSATAAVGAS